MFELIFNQVYHPNIDLEGNVCLNILREDWKPVLNVNTVIYGLNLLFMVLVIFKFVVLFSSILSKCKSEWQCISFFSFLSNAYLGHISTFHLLSMYCLVSMAGRTVMSIIALTLFPCKASYIPSHKGGDIKALIT